MKKEADGEAAGAGGSSSISPGAVQVILSPAPRVSVNQPLAPTPRTRMLGPAPFQPGVIYGEAMNPPLVACVELFM